MSPRRRKTTCANEECRRPCIPQDRGLCEGCLRAYRAKHDRERIGKREQSHYDAAWVRLRKREIDRHIAIHGLWCPVCKRMVKQRRDLTLDHVQARSLERGVQVMCRSCNAKKGDRRVE